MSNIDTQIYLLLAVPALLALLLGFGLAKLHSHLYGRPRQDPMPSDHRGCTTLYAAFPPGGGPPTGRRVIDRAGRVWVRQPDGEMLITEWLSPAVNLAPDDQVMNPLHLVDLAGPLVLLPLTQAERDHEALYGPSYGRWGTIGQPCEYRDCRLFFGHVGPHTGKDGFVLPFPTLAHDAPVSVPRGYSADEANQCTCGRPDHHRPTCPRYRRMIGGTHAPND